MDRSTTRLVTSCIAILVVIGFLYLSSLYLGTMTEQYATILVTIAILVIVATAILIIIGD